MLLTTNRASSRRISPRSPRTTTRLRRCDAAQVRWMRAWACGKVTSQVTVSSTPADRNKRLSSVAAMVRGVRLGGRGEVKGVPAMVQQNPTASHLGI